MKQNIIYCLKKYGSLFGVEEFDESLWTATKIFNWILLKIFWMVVITSLLALTIQESIELCQRFVQQPTTYSMTVMKNKPFPLPKSTVCLPLYGFTLGEVMSGNFTNNTLAVIEYFNDTELTKEEFLTNNGSSKWPGVVMDYLSTILFLESESYPFNNFVFSTNYSNFSATLGKYQSFAKDFDDDADRGYISEDSWNAQFIFENYLQKLNISFNELRQALGQKLISLFGLSVWHFVEGNDTMVGRPIEKFQATFMSWSYACFDIDFPQENVSINSALDSVQFKMNPHPLLNTTSFAMPWFFVDLIGRFGLAMEYNQANIGNWYNVMYSGVGYGSRKNDQLFFTKLQTEYQAMSIVRGEIQCLDKTTTDMCRQECNCTPMSLPLYTNDGNDGRQLPTIADCSFAKLNNCLSYKTATGSACRKKCLPPCNVRNYAIQAPSTSSLGSQQFARITLMNDDFTYAIYVEDYDYGTEDIIGALGGVLGLWLGLDLTKIINLLGSAIYFVYRFIFTCCRSGHSKDNNSVVEEEGEEENEFQLRTVVVVPRDHQV